MRGLWCVATFLLFSAALSAANNTGLNQAEHDELDARLRQFYTSPWIPGVMDRANPKFGVETGNFVDPNPVLKMKGSAAEDPLLQQAQAKGTEKFQQAWCDRFPCARGQANETAWEDDQVADLAHTWMEPSEIAHSLDEIPISGKVSTPYWSGDYWRMKWGLTSYRYADGISYSTYGEAVEAYREPDEWRNLIQVFDLEKIAQAVVNWSPAEKYDLMVGDERFTLTNEQKAEGKGALGDDGDVESWFGLCHGWAPASVFVAPPKGPVTALSTKGARVTWYPDDVKAMVTLAWANGRFPTNFAGERCRAQKPKRFRNGRLSAHECFDTNPSTLHRALGNLIGKRGVPFVMDAAYDYQVWNQPILEYELEYFNPLNANSRSRNWEDVAVPYDETFKRNDRFQEPLTRGEFLSDGNYDDSGIRKIVGVIATVVYLAETSAVHSPSPTRASRVRVTYTYDLELHEQGNRLVALGGEWHENTHPDFLWAPQRGAVPLRSEDEQPFEVRLDREPKTELSSAARSAAKRGYPLCKVIAALVEGSSAGGTYSCGNP